MLDFLSHQSTTRDKKFGKENMRNSVKEIFNRGGSSYKRQLQRLKMNKLIFSFYDKKIKKAPMEIFY